jgi:hypothetical protein
VQQSRFPPSTATHGGTVHDVRCRREMPDPHAGGTVMPSTDRCGGAVCGGYTESRLESRDGAAALELTAQPAIIGIKLLSVTVPGMWAISRK